MARVTETVTETLKDIAYIVVGFGILGFQRVQVRRHELAKQLGPQLEDLVTNVDEAFQPVRIELDQRLDRVEERLSGQARDVVRTARALAKETEQQMRRAVGAPAPGERSRADGSATQPPAA
jgi:hypothetical protein